MCGNLRKLCGNCAETGEVFLGLLQPVGASQTDTSAASRLRHTAPEAPRFILGKIRLCTTICGKCAELVVSMYGNVRKLCGKCAEIVQNEVVPEERFGMARDEAERARCGLRGLTPFLALQPAGKRSSFVIVIYTIYNDGCFVPFTIDIYIYIYINTEP
jgi:hypothetical protein